MNELKNQAYHCAVAYGWHKQNLSNEHCLCLVISELMGAVEADRKGRHALRIQFVDYMGAMKRSDDEFFYAFTHTIKDSVEDKLSDALLSGEIIEGDKVTVGATKGKITMKVRERTAKETETSNV